jgi:hypothetical protein
MEQKKESVGTSCLQDLPGEMPDRAYNRHHPARPVAHRMIPRYTQDDWELANLVESAAIPNTILAIRSPGLMSFFME